MSVEWGQGLSRNRARYQSRCHFWARISPIGGVARTICWIEPDSPLASSAKHNGGWDELMSISSEEGLQSHCSLFLTDEVDLLVDISI